MAQNWTDNTYAPDHVGQTDLQNIEYNFACLKSMFSGGSAPSNTVAGMPWFDTTQLVPKIRNSTNNAWLGLMHGDTDQKVWVYRDSAMDGWAVDSSVTDRVIAIKGGSEAYNVSGGNLAGTWSLGITHTHPSVTHNHQWYNFRNTNHDAAWDSNGNTRPINNYTDKYSGYAYIEVQGSVSGGRDRCLQDMWTSNATIDIGNPSPSTITTWRPAAAVGTLQYLDL